MIEANTNEISRDLENQWDIVTEGIQTYLRAEGLQNPYNLMKQNIQTQIKQTGCVSQIGLAEFIGQLNLDPIHTTKLLSLTPSNYVPVLSSQHQSIIQQINI